MTAMPARVRELLERVPTAVLATVDPDGVPNAVPIGAKRTLDDGLVLISDQFFNKTLANMRANPHVSVLFWEGREGYQLKGTVTIDTEGPRYLECARWIEELDRAVQRPFPLRSKGAVLLTVEAIYSVAPGPGAGKRIA